jgi:hypothetical protein
VGFLSASLGLGTAIGAFTIAAYALIVVSALLLPETNGISLHDVAVGPGTGKELTASVIANKP